MRRERRFLDVNMLIALAWPSHIHHGPAHAWFAANAVRGWATCPLTQCGFVRISSNPGIIPEAVTPQAALDLLRQIVANKHHAFWPDDIAAWMTPYPVSGWWDIGRLPMPTFWGWRFGTAGGWSRWTKAPWHWRRPAVRPRRRSNLLTIDARPRNG